MGKITNALRHEVEKALRQKVVPISPLLESITREDDASSYRDSVEQGSDPLHAVYVTTINLISTFLESAQDLAPMRQAVRFITEKEELYMPSYPPMSPLTTSYFSTWTQLDVPFGADRETVGDCLAGLSDLLQIGEVQQKALARLRESRLGIYQITSASEELWQVRELVTGTEVETLIPSGFHGKPGEILLVRLLPSLEGETPYHVAVTTPYILRGAPVPQWIEYFARHQIIPATVGLDERLRQHMKLGPTPEYWAEYIFWGYVNHRSDAVFLTGFPDRPETQPHHPLFNQRGNTPGPH